MSFMVMIAISLFTLSHVNVTVAAQAQAKVKAQANAKMAMMIAIGELQEAMGPDKRISARAAILDNNPKNVGVDGVANPHYLGAWDSWDTWLTDSKDSLTIQDTYTRGRQPLFRKWLVSHADSDPFDEEVLNTAINSTPAAPVSMWTKPKDPNEVNPAGPALQNPEDHVVAGRVPVLEGNRKTGSYAWWVTDESQKARLDLKARDDASTFVDAQNASTQTGRMGIETMTDMASFDTTPESIAKMITIAQANISAPKASERFNDITAHSVGLLTDVRSGGFKRDFNLAFESNDVPEEMRETKLFGERPFEAPIRPMTGELANITPQNPYIAPMGWRRICEHYRLYREFNGSDILKPIKWSGDNPFTRRFIMGLRDDKNKWDVAGYTRLPVLLRQTWVLATLSESNPTTANPNAVDYFITAVPIVSYWNPYNIPLEVDSIEISTLGSLRFAAPLYFKVYLDGVFHTEDQLKSTVGFSGDGGQAGYRMVPVENGLNTIRFEPGEVRIFSTNEEFNEFQSLYDFNTIAHDFPATPGYQPIQAGPNNARGLKYKLGNSIIPAGETRTPSIALRMASSDIRIDTFWAGGSRDSIITYMMQEAYGAQEGIYYEDRGISSGRAINPQSSHVRSSEVKGSTLSRRAVVKLV